MLFVSFSGFYLKDDSGETEKSLHSDAHPLPASTFSDLPKPLFSDRFSSLSLRIPSQASALCAQPCVRTRIPSLCSESSPQIVQTSPGRLAGASALTSPIHPSLDACQPGAARAVSMETSNKSARTPPFTCEQRLREQTGSGPFVVHLSP